MTTNICDNIVNDFPKITDGNKNKNQLTINSASFWATNFYNKNITPANITYLIKYGKITKNIVNNQILVNKTELKNYFEKMLKNKKYTILYKDYNYIKTYFNNLNGDHSHFVNSNDICTPIECIKEMVDTIPSSFWKNDNLKILDCCCGNGNFHSYINFKTELKNLYFCEINKKRIQNVREYFGKNINLFEKDFLSFENKEEYDLVVANPPYAKFDTDNNRVSKNHNLARDFIRKALNITKYGGYTLFIVPNNWMSFSDRNDLPMELSKYQFIHLDIGGAKKYFKKVGSSFTWFLLQKIPNTKPFTITNTYIQNDTQVASIDRGISFVPLYYSELVRNIVNKTINNVFLPKYKIETSSFLHHHTKQKNIRDKKDNEFYYKLIHTPTQICYSNIPHKFQDGYKVFLSLSNQYGTFIDDCGMTQSVAYIRCKNKEESEKIKSELDNEIYIFLNNITRYGNFNNVRVLQNFPILGSFELTREETNFIEEFNKKYYGKK
ncbi:MAG: class I SAM-dependent methyltransferase [Rickettsiales bacterium]|nr:class I SAM-dependent methyltransferase [Rickettsiales bacterium]